MRTVVWDFYTTVPSGGFACKVVHTATMKSLDFRGLFLDNDFEEFRQKPPNPSKSQRSARVDSMTASPNSFTPTVESTRAQPASLPAQSARGAAPRHLLGPLPRLRIYTDSRHYARVLRELLSGRTNRGGDVAALESEAARRLHTRFAIAMPMARVGIYFAVKNLIKPGQKVILSPYTIADVVNMVVCAGGQPVFADIERATCNVDPAEIERLIDSDTGAVLVTHFYGLACDIEKIADICRRRNLPLIEDAAQSFGARVNGRPVGTFGDAGILSFGMYKNVNSFLGGMIVTSNEALRDKIAAQLQQMPLQDMRIFLAKVMQAAQVDVVTWPGLFRLLFFRVFRYAFLNDVNAINNRVKIDIEPVLKTEMPADYLARMRPLQARLILSQLDRVERDTRRRIEAAQRYFDGLHDIPEIICPPRRDDSSHIYWYYPIQAPDRHALVAYAMRNGRDITESYHRNCADLPCFSRWRRDCPRARATADSLIYLPTYPRYSDAEIDRTVAVIRRYFGK